MKLREYIYGCIFFLGLACIFALFNSIAEGFTRISYSEYNIPTFHILIATGGRPSLKRMLDSLKDELLENDAVTIVFDGPDALKKSTYDSSWTTDFKCTINIIEQNPGLGYWGHGARNKYQGQLTPKTTFIMNADDDDEYVSGSFNLLRKKCINPNTLYISKMGYINNSKIIPSQNKDIVRSDIGTPNGIIPFNIAASATWELRYGGDFDYYNILQTHADMIEFLDIITYMIY